MRQKGFVPIILLVVAGLVIAGVVAWSFFQKAKIPPPPKPSTNEVIVTTDKTEYLQGENVKITVKNGLNQPIYYMGDLCEPHHFEIERSTDNNWQPVERILCVVLGAKSDSISSEVPPQDNLIEKLRKMLFKPKPKGTKLEPNREINEIWEPLKRTNLDGTTFIEAGTYRISFSYGQTASSYNEKTVYSNEFSIKGKEYSDYGPIIDVNLTIDRNNTVTETEPIEVTAGRRTSPSILKKLEGDYVLEVGTKVDQLRIGTILWSQSFPVDFGYTGPIEEGIDYSNIKYGSQLVSFKIPYAPEMKALRLWYLKATVDWSKTKEPKIIFFKELPKFYNLHGKVKGNKDSFIGQASIELYQGEKIAGNTHTDENGEYFFSEVKPGEYRIIIRPPASQNVLIGDKKNVIMTDDKVTTVDITLQPCGSIAGKITDPQGKPLADAFAQIVGFETPQNHVSDDGTYMIPYLDPGEYRVKAEVKIGKDYIEISPKSIKVELGKTSTVNFVFGE